MNPAQIGPTMRTKLINELLNPMAAPWPMVACFEVKESTAGRRKVLDRTKKPVASKMVGYVLASNNTRNPTEPVSNEVLMTEASPQRRVSDPVNTLPTADTKPTT